MLKVKCQLFDFDLVSWYSVNSSMRRIRFKSSSKSISKGIHKGISEWKEFSIFFQAYLREKTVLSSGYFEGKKNIFVKNVLIKRGKGNRLFLHVTVMVVLTIGIIISPFITETQLFSNESNQITFAESSEDTLSLSQESVFSTQSTDSVRDEIISYNVQKGDTVSSIARKFGVTEDTIKWQNSLKSDTISIGDTLEILPVTGVAHKVTSGETIHSIAKKYDAAPQAIADFPFNDFANPQTFSLVTGQIVIVPDGVVPEAKAQPQYTRRAFIATGPVTVTDAGFTWPVPGTLNQSYAWYHRAIDIGAGLGAPVVSAQSGRVSEVYTSGYNGGYGVHVIITGDNGYSTLYAHMSGVNVSAGDRVGAGSTVIGWVGLTGRTTGPHLHFEVRSSGGLLNPLSFLR